MTEFEIGTQWGPVSVDISSDGERIHLRAQRVEPSETLGIIRLSLENARHIARIISQAVAAADWAKSEAMDSEWEKVRRQIEKERVAASFGEARADARKWAEIVLRREAEEGRPAAGPEDRN